MYKVIPFLISLFVLFSCTSQPTKEQNLNYKMLPNESPHANLIIYRNSGFVGVGANPDILINGTKNIDIVGGRYQHYKLPPGEYTIEADCNFWKGCGLPDSTTQIKIEENEKYYLRYETGINSMFFIQSSAVASFNTSLVRVKRTEALSEIEKLIYATAVITEDED